MRNNEDKGHGGNFLCLTNAPTGLDTSPDEFNSAYGQIWGAHYEFPSSNSNRPLDEFGVPCALCQAKSRNSFMIPGTNTCPTSTNTEYVGKVMSGASFSAPELTTEYICVNEPLGDTGIVNDASDDLDGSRLGFVQSNCLGGYLPCNLYPNHAFLPCVVCSN